MLKKFALATVTSCGLLSACSQVTELRFESEPETNAPKNIIMVVADGMGPAYTTAYRNFSDDPLTPNVDPVIFDKYLVGNASTYPAPVSGLVTDSAAAATALATGVKTYNGAVGVDENKQPVKSVLHQAKLLGMRTGVAVTSQIVHATPASYIAHNESRKNYNQIADSFFDERLNGEIIADVMLGGGTDFFEREDRDLIAQFIDADYQYVDTYNKLATLPAGSDVIGLFAPVGLPWVLDDKRKNRLAYLTEHAIKHLENDKGFFLLVEASQVDWAGHANDVASAMAEMHDLAQAMEYLEEYVAANPDTLVVLTADHSTGGFTIGAAGDYRWSPEYLKKLKASVSSVAKKLNDVANPGVFVGQQFGFSLTEEESEFVSKLAQETDAMKRSEGLKAIIDMRTNTGWTTGGHTGVDVEVFAFGAGHEAFRGQLANTDIAKNIFKFLGKDKRVSKEPKGNSLFKFNSDDDKAEKPKQQSTEDDSDVACDFKTDWRCL